MWTAIISALTGGFGQWMEHRRQKQDAKHERELAIIKSEDRHDTLVSEGWKDEYLTIIFTSPIVAIFAGAFLNKPEWIDAAEQGITAVGGLPEWYQVILGTIVLGSFSLRGYHAWRSYRAEGK